RDFDKKSVLEFFGRTCWNGKFQENGMFVVAEGREEADSERIKRVKGLLLRFVGSTDEMLEEGVRESIKQNINSIGKELEKSHWSDNVNLILRRDLGLLKKSADDEKGDPKSGATSSGTSASTSANFSDFLAREPGLSQLWSSDSLSDHNH